VNEWTGRIGPNGAIGRNGATTRIGRSGATARIGRSARIARIVRSGPTWRRRHLDGKHMSKSTISFVLWTMLTAALPPSAFAQGARATWQFGSSPTFSSGTYGTDARTEVLFMPITARRLFNDGDLAFVFPFTCIWGSGGVTVVDGLPVRQDQVRGGTTTTTPTRGEATNPRLGPLARVPPLVPPSPLARAARAISSCGAATT
jgi:hypothetical protein